MLADRYHWASPDAVLGMTLRQLMFWASGGSGTRRMTRAQLEKYVQAYRKNAGAP